MKKEELEKYISDLSPELQAQARECKDMKELNTLLAENDVELSDDALEAVSGGCSLSSDCYDQGDVTPAICPKCSQNLYYWDMIFEGDSGLLRLYCNNPSCESYHNGLWYVITSVSSLVKPTDKVYKYN